VADEEDAIDIADPLRVGIRIYRVRKAGSKTGNLQVQPVRDGGAQSTGQSSRSFILIIFISDDEFARKRGADEV
jgi:hypothetical protein